MQRMPVVLFIVAALVMGLAAPASARQLDARTPPKVTGGLQAQAFDCSRIVKNFRGKTILRGDACLWFYSIDPLQEFDLQQDHGAVWFQYDLDAAPGWCVTSTTTRIGLGALGVRKWPNQTVKASRPKRVTARVEVHPGNDPREFSLEQPFTLYPRSLSSAYNNDHSQLTVRWKGRTTKPTALATGAELTWLAIVDAPGEVSYSLGYNLASC